MRDMKMRKIFFFSIISAEGYPEKTGGMGEKSPGFRTKNAPFWGRKCTAGIVG